MRLPWSVWFCLYLPFIALLLTVRPAVAGEAGEIVSVLGTADVLRGGRWQPVRAGDSISAGEVVRTGAGSRVAIQLANGSQLKLNANSQLELKQLAPRPEGFIPATAQIMRNILRILSGEIWIRSVGEPLQIQTPLATATIRGTEFNLVVDPGDSVRLAVLTGLVEFSNPQGSVLVEKGEQATAKPGEAPRKTVLVDPLDAVQWSLYYPGIVSYRDYPLTTLAPSQRQSQFAAATKRAAAAPRDVNALIELGEISFDLGKQAEARQVFTQVLRLDPGNFRARTGLGWVYLASGEVKAALLEFQQPQPPTLMTLVGMANALYRLNRLDESNRIILEAERRFPTSPIPWTQAALNELIQGRVTEALQALDRAQKLTPHYAPAYGLRSNIDLVRNQRARALEAAQQAIAADPDSPSAWLSLSLVKQAEFQLDDALQAAHKAVELDPDNPQTLIQESRLLFGRGQIEKAFKLAEKARQKGPPDALVNSTWGFLQLARFHVDKAIAAFQQSIVEDSTRGEPHLGLGITLFRQNKTRKAVAEMEKATLLEPQVSLYQSYLGKAYYEIKQDRLAQKHLALAKQLDPRDPTPYFYDAILKDSINRPIEAIQSVQKSIELNDDRAVYRSRLLLDEDLAVRGSTLGYLYNELGFERLALVEGWNSVDLDPTNYSAHRLLADAYTPIPRHEVARVSELLQAQLLQPLNITPVQPRLAETRLLMPEGIGPATPSLYEYNPLFVRDRWSLLASGVTGNNNTLADELVLYGNENKFSYSLGQFYYASNGFRENSDLHHNIYNLFAQAAVAPNFNLQAELRRRETEQGYLALNFDPYDFSPTNRTKINQDSARLGAHATLSPQSDVIASFTYANRNEKVIFADDPDFKSQIEAEDQGYKIEAQYLLRTDRFNTVVGAGDYKIDVNFHSVIDYTRSTGISCPFANTCENSIPSLGKWNNAYIYNHISYPNNMIWTLGSSYDVFQEGKFHLNKLNPKLGLQWDITKNARLRFAAFQTIKPLKVIEQTLEPTQLAGFNQFFDDVSGTEARRYGIGFDDRLTERFYGGAEILHSDLKVASFELDNTEKLNNIEDQEQNLYRTYLYWIPNLNWALSIEYQFEQFRCKAGTECNISPVQLNTMNMPVTVLYFNSSGLFVKLQETYVHQNIEDLIILEDNRSLTRDQSDFFLSNAAIGYRLPQRWGIVSLEAINLFDKKFKFQDLNFLTSEATNPLFIPERLLFCRLTLNF